MSNPVWKRYILNSLPNWLDWFANNHTASHIQLFEKFILANPYYVADLEKLEDEQDEFMLSLIYDEEFINSLSEKGLTVWYYSDFKDFLQTLEPYTKANRDLMIESVEAKLRVIDSGYEKSLNNIGEPGYTSAKRLAKSGRPVFLKQYFKDHLSKEKYKTFNTTLPNLDVRHDNNFTGPKRGRKRTYSIPYWGKFSDVIKGEIDGHR